MPTSPFEKNVFINCPFDDDYWELFRVIVFTTLRMGCTPLYSLIRSDSGEARITKITELIKKSQFGIHDLSRCVAMKKGEIFRLNMPLELGLDMGAKSFGSPQLRKKKILIIEEQRYRFQKAISDLSNSDIKAHDADSDKLAGIIRDWLVQEAKVPHLPHSFIWGQFNDFEADLFKTLKAQGYQDKDIDKLNEHERIKHMEKWILDNPLPDHMRKL